MVVSLAEAYVVQDEELRLWPEVGGVADTSGLEVRLGLLRYVSGIAGIRFACHGILDVANKDQCRCRAERVDERGGGVRHQQHVTFLNFLEPADTRTVKPDALLEGVLGELLSRHREVLPQAGQVDEAQIDGLDPLVLN